MRTLGLLFVAFCMATVLAQAAAMGYLVATGGISRPKLARVIAVLYGFELVAETPAAGVPGRAVGHEAGRPADALTLRSQKLDLRERFIEGQQAALAEERRKLMAEASQFAEARDAFRKQRDEWESGQQAQGIDEAVLLIGKLSPSQAKEQILLSLGKGEIDWVVSLMRKLPADRQAKIAGEFTTPEETQRLADIIRRIRDAQPPLAPNTGAKSLPE
jgi:hypothetical protein